MSINCKYRFSVVVPIYNIEEYLPKCVDSILSQTFSNFELILVDDGSTDRSCSICDNYKDSDNRVKVIHKKNGGVISARQEGANKAEGEYIVCVDGDDWIEHNYLSAFNTQIENYHPDIVCCGYVKSKSNSEVVIPLKNRNGFYNREQIEKEIFPDLIQSKEASYFLPTLWSKAIKRENFQHEHQQLIGCNVAIGEDGACVIPLVYHSNSLVVIDDCPYHYRVNETSVTRNKNAFKWDGPQMIGEHIQQRINMNENNFGEQLDRKTCHEVFTVVISRFSQSKGYKEIRKDIVEGLGNPYYKKAIANATFSSTKAKFMHYCLKYKLIEIMWFYSKIKKS